MDSVVDAFFPIMDFVDYEANELDVFSVGPNEATTEENADGASPPAKPKSMSGKSGGYKHYDGSVVGIQVDSPSEQDLEKLSRMPTNSTIKRATVERVVPVNVLRGALSIPISATVAKLLPRRLLTRALKPFRTKVLVDEHGIELQTLTPPPPRPNRGLVPDGVSVSAAAKHTLDAIMLGKTPRERAAMLQRITQMRRIVTGLNRLLGPKTDVVRGLRKRVLEEDAALFRGDFKHDIAVYIGDLQGESVQLAPPRECESDSSGPHSPLSRRPHSRDAAVAHFLRRDPGPRPPRVPVHPPVLTPVRQARHRHQLHQAVPDRSHRPPPEHHHGPVLDQRRAAAQRHLRGAARRG